MNVSLLRNELNSELNKLPQVSGNGGDVQISRQLLNLLNLCDKLAQQNKINLFPVNCSYWQRLKSAAH